MQSAKGISSSVPVDEIPQRPQNRPFAAVFATPGMAAATIRPASRENGSDWIQTLPGPVNRAKNRPSPPNSALRTPPTVTRSNSTEGV
jgi:hypothetical protein